ncbi:MAG: hypothetical protein PQJ50_12110 [Spirochaetales bacterium]|nr:hypothetical protein [Spirochaetales bacterium]
MNPLYRYVHRWSSDKSQISFITIPMIHIGEKSFYDEVNLIIDEANHILYEGVKTGARHSDFGKYRKMAAMDGDLTAQYDSIRFPEDIKRINIDISADEFKSGRSPIPFQSIFREKVSLLLLNLYLKKHSLKNLLKNQFSYPAADKYKLVDPKNHYFFTHRKKDRYSLLIENRRDEIFRENLRNYIDENKNREYPLESCILVGDNHMPAVYRELEEQGFKWQLHKTLTVVH